MYVPPHFRVTDEAEKLKLIRSYQALGVNHISLRFHWETPKDFISRMEWFAERVMPALA